MTVSKLQVSKLQVSKLAYFEKTVYGENQKI